MYKKFHLIWIKNDEVITKTHFFAKLAIFALNISVFKKYLLINYWNYHEPMVPCVLPSESARKVLSQTIVQKFSISLVFLVLAKYRGFQMLRFGRKLSRIVSYGYKCDLYVSWNTFFKEGTHQVLNVIERNGKNQSMQNQLLIHLVYIFSIFTDHSDQNMDKTDLWRKMVVLTSSV